ncbi:MULTISPECIES: serine/threonine dehydratase [unclassified Streptomyces]|uniref:serine/threonine dehydratase n=1 Tax=unclassified Streptomyces TaxID=2593676 RepID=UPI003D93B095
MTIDEVREAADRIGPYIRTTPVLTAEIDSRQVTLKLENLQATGSFKFRGALNAVIAGNTEGEVVAASGGNHGLGVATAAKIMGLAATVYVPWPTPEAKVRRITAQGARVVRHGERYADAEAAALAWADQSGGSFLHPYDDPAVIAGQGTVGLEIAEHAPWCDSVAAAVGGGGLTAGLSVGLGPDRTVVAVEPEHCNGLHAAFSAGFPVDAPVDSVAASALGVSRVGRNTFALLSSGRVRLAMVTEQEIAHARNLLWEELRLAVEPAAAVPFAAWLAGRVPGRHPCLVLCGANTDWHPV